MSDAMNRAKISWIAITGSLVLISSGWANIPARYQTILERNPFGLNTPVVEKTTGEQITPPPRLSLTGIATINGKKRAFLVVHPKDHKEQLQHVTLSENQRDGILEILKISEENGKVKIKYGEQEMALTFKANNMISSVNRAAK